MYACYGFVEEEEDEWITLAQMQEMLPAFYRKWMGRLEELALPDLRQSKLTRWYYLENSRGERLDFRNYSDSVLELIDDMETQCEYIGENLAAQIHVLCDKECEQ